MKKILLTLIISFLTTSFAMAKEVTFVSLSPALTEIIYALGAEDNLKAVSESCTYPKEALKKEKVGNSFFINEEKILKIKPDYILAPDSSELLLRKFEKYNIKPLCLKNSTIDNVFDNVLTLGKLTNKEENAKKIVKIMEKNILQSNQHKNKRVLYLVQTSPMITIGKNCFITDVITKSGNKSVTQNLKQNYPVISEEYGIKQNPDIVVVAFGKDERLNKLFPKSKIVYLKSEELDIINRPSIRIYKSVEFFARL